MKNLFILLVLVFILSSCEHKADDNPLSISFDDVEKISIIDSSDVKCFVMVESDVYHYMIDYESKKIVKSYKVDLTGDVIVYCAMTAVFSIFITIFIAVLIVDRH